jgi:hypothetical protein
MEETTEKYPTRLEDFNTDDPDNTPYRICNKSHFSICWHLRYIYNILKNFKIV